MMDKTININLGGTLFSIDGEAYRILRDYLNALDLKFRNVPGGSETMEDIESRIAEIFTSQKGVAGVITRENVESMISTIGRPEDFGLTDNEPLSGTYTTAGNRKMFRNSDDAIIAGICGGIGTYLNADTVWIRILFVVLALMGGLGIFIYLALWIALPAADTDSRKKEMYGTADYRQKEMAIRQYKGDTASSRLGNAFNEVFRAFGKVLFIVVRIFLIILGTTLVITGFLTIVTFIMIAVFKYPGSFSTDAAGINLSYMPDLLNYIVSPAIVPWVKGLLAIVICLPMLALIYGGVRLIFWFRARDGFIWLAGLIIWVMSTAALSILLFNEGIGFTESGRSTTGEYFSVVPDTLYIRSGVKLADLTVDKEITVPGEEYETFYISDSKNEIYFRTNLDISPAEDRRSGIEISRRSFGRSKTDAKKRAERLLYNSEIKGKTLYLDEFFTIPAFTKWSFDYVSVRIRVPVGTVIYMDKTVEHLFHPYSNDHFVNDSVNRFWKMTDEGISYIDSGLRK